ncbi:MAG: polysaccharide biosynthesis protein [Patescibacteria group bacterium]|jgi:UDP-glucose 4-epimerase
MFRGKRILVTGGTGSFGHQIVNDLIPYEPAEIRVFSRDEKKQHDMRLEYPDVKFLTFVIGDVRDAASVRSAMRGIDIVFNAAALKQVPSCEYHVIQAVKTNILGPHNVIEAALQEDVEKVITISTDKACEPINAMGISKAMQERLFVSANLEKGNKRTVFAGVRYGNVLGSRGSVVPLFKQLAEEGKDLPITDRLMTRFIITLPQSIELVFYAAEHAVGGEMFVKKMPAHTITDLAEIILARHGKNENQKVVEKGIRPGEKIHESLVSPSESLHCIDQGDYFVILPQISLPDVEAKYGSLINNLPGPTQQKSFRYSSENTQRLSKEDLGELLKNEGWI